MPAHKYNFEAIGTKWSIETDSPLTVRERDDIQDTVEQFDRTYSRFRTDSLVSHARQSAPGSFAFPADIAQLMLVYAKLHALSDGRINPLVGESLEHLGYDADYSLTPTTPQPALDFSLLSRHGAHLHFDQPALLDIGAIGKGLLIDKLSERIGKNHESYVVDGSGDIRLHTDQVERIGLEDPSSTARVIGQVNVRHGSLCASATNRRAWGAGLHHVIDATTGLPLSTDIIGTWAIADSAMKADALTTGLFYCSTENLFHAFGDFYYVILKRDYTITHNITSEVGEIYS